MEQPNRMIEKLIIENKKKYFFKMDWKENIYFQMCKGNKAYVHNLPHACQAKENYEWLQKKLHASKMQF